MEYGRSDHILRESGKHTADEINTGNTGAATRSIAAAIADARDRAARAAIETAYLEHALSLAEDAAAQHLDY